MKAVLFDLDGTLTDSSPGITACIQHALRQLGRPVPEADTLRWCIGPPLAGSFAKLLASADPELVTQAVALYRSRFAATGFAENAIYAGVPEALRKVRSMGCRLFVVTSKPEVYAAKIVAHFNMSGMFDGVHGSEMSGARSDKAELIAHIMRMERLSPADTIMIGDRAQDVIGARRCAIPCIGVAYGYGGREELRESGAVAIAEQPDEIPALVERHLD